MTPKTSTVQISHNVCTPEDRLRNAQAMNGIEVTKNTIFGVFDNKSLIIRFVA